MNTKFTKVMFSFAAIMVMVLLLFLFSPMGMVRAGGGLDIIATGLNNPRGIESGPDGMLYVAEAGIGGPSEDDGGTCAIGPTGNRCYGETGAISRVNIDGTNQQRIISNMVSLADPMAFGVGPASAAGPHDVAFDANGDLFVTVGWGGDPVSRTIDFGPEGANFAQLAMVTHVMTDVYTWTNVADLGQYEVDNNPDGRAVDSNPFGLATDGSGFAVVDAGGNSLLQVDPMAPSISTLASFPTRTAMFITMTIPMDPVPTEVVVDGNGDYIVGQLTGFPFPVDGGWVFDVPDGGGTPTPREISFTHPIDVVKTGSGNLFVLQMDDDALFFGPGVTGSVIQVHLDGTRTVLEDMLGLPVGMTMGSDGALYVTACTQPDTIPEPCLPGQGVVVRVPTEAPTDVSLSGIDGTASNNLTVVVLLLTMVILVPVAAVILRRRGTAG